MKIQIIQSIAGNAEPMYELDDFSFAPGSVIEIRDVLAQAWIDSGIAIAGRKSDKLTMPPEAHAYRAPKLQVVADVPVVEAATIDYEKAALFLRSRGYETETADAAAAFIEKFTEEDRASFLADLSMFDPQAAPASDTAPAPATEADLAVGTETAPATETAAGE